jgi:hypothetical protein
MFDRRSAIEKFRLAVQNFSSNCNSTNDAPIQILASIFRIAPATESPTATTSSDNNDSKGNKVNSEAYVSANGTDWSSVVNPWLDVCEASTKVSNDTFIVFLF